MRTIRAHLLWILCLSTLLTACRKEEPPGPAQTVVRFHKLAEAGDWEAALKLVDLDSKCRTMLGDVYAQGPEADRTQMQQLWGRRLQSATETYFEKHFGDSLGELTEKALADDAAEVVQRKGKFTLVYSLQRRPEGWIIVDRIHELDGVRPDPARGIQVILKRIEGELGHKPTLAELNQHLEEYMERLRIRRIPVTTTGQGAK